MADTHSGTRLLAFVDSVLTAAAVARLEQTLRESRDTCPTVLDCASLHEVTPAGLSALLELGRSVEGIQELALAGLGHNMMLAAIYAGLAERFSIYTTTAAFEQDHRRVPDERGEGACAL